MSEDILKLDWLDKRASLWNSFNLKNSCCGQKLISNSVDFITFFKALWKEWEWKLFIVAYSIIQLDWECWKNKFFVVLELLFISCSLNWLFQELNVIKSIRVEHVKLALPENSGKVSKEFNIEVLNLSISLFLTDSVHELVNVATALMRISPFFHLDSKWELLLSNLKNLGDLFLFLKFYWEWDSVVLLWVLV